jgi:hypothetical protein
VGNKTFTVHDAIIQSPRLSGSIELETHICDTSINRHAVVQPPLLMQDPTMIEAGAHAFTWLRELSRWPGVAWAKFSEGLRPDPPALKDAVKDLNAQIFSVIRNGTNMTGMPGFNLEI